MAKIIPLLIFLALPFLIGNIASFIGYNMSWYDTLIRPSLTPPGWVFPVVWTVLYLMIGLSGYIAFINKANFFALAIFGIQLIFNGLFSVAFFVMRNLNLSFYITVLLAFMVLLNIISFYFINKTSAYLLIPYFCWCCFASYLAFSLTVLNA